MGLSRSGFLKQLAGSALEVMPLLAPVLSPALSPALSLAASPDQGKDPQSGWREIGSLADFAPGTLTPVLAGRYLVLAHSQGLYALAADQARGACGPRLALRLEFNGRLALNPQQTWPEGCCLSALTGNRIQEAPAHLRDLPLSPGQNIKPLQSKETYREP